MHLCSSQLKENKEINRVFIQFLWNDIRVIINMNFENKTSDLVYFNSEHKADDTR